MSTQASALSFPGLAAPTPAAPTPTTQTTSQSKSTAPTVTFNHISFLQLFEDIQQPDIQTTILTKFDDFTKIFLNLSQYYSRCSDDSLAAFKSTNPADSDDNNTILTYANLINFSPQLIQFHYNSLKSQQTKASPGSKDATPPTIDVILYTVYQDLISCLKVGLFFIHLFTIGYSQSQTTLSSRSSSIEPSKLYSHIKTFLYSPQIATAKNSSQHSTNFVRVFFSLVSLLGLLLAPYNIHAAELTLHNDMIANGQPLPWLTIKADYTVVAESITLTLLAVLSNHISTASSSNTSIITLFTQHSDQPTSRRADRTVQLEIQQQIAATLPLIFSLLSTTTFGLSQTLLQYTTSTVSLSNNSSQKPLINPTPAQPNQLDQFSTLLINFNSTTDNLDYLLSNIPYLFVLTITNILPLQLSAELIAQGQSDWSNWQQEKKKQAQLAQNTTSLPQSDLNDDWVLSESVFNALVWYFSSITTNLTLLEFIDQSLTSYHATITTPTHPCYAALSLLMISTTLHLSNYVSIVKITYDAFPFDLSSTLDTIDLYATPDNDVSFHLYADGQNVNAYGDLNSGSKKRLLLARTLKQSAKKRLDDLHTTFLGKQGGENGPEFNYSEFDRQDDLMSDRRQENDIDLDAAGSNAAAQSQLDPFTQFAFQRLSSMAVPMTHGLESGGLQSPSYYEHSNGVTPIEFGSDFNFISPSVGPNHLNTSTTLFGQPSQFDNNSTNPANNRSRDDMMLFPSGVPNRSRFDEDGVFNTSASITDDYDTTFGDIDANGSAGAAMDRASEWKKHVKPSLATLSHSRDTKLTHQATFQNRIMYTVDHLDHFLTIISDRLSIALDLNCFQRMLTYLPTIHRLEEVLNGYLFYNTAISAPFAPKISHSSNTNNNRNHNNSPILPDSAFQSTQTTQWFHSVVLHTYIAVIIALFHSQCYYPCISTPSPSTISTNATLNKTAIGVQAMTSNNSSTQLNLTMSVLPNNTPSPQPSTPTSPQTPSNEYNILTVLSHLIQFYTQAASPAYLSQVDHFSQLYHQLPRSTQHLLTSTQHQMDSIDDFDVDLDQLPQPPQINFLVQTIAFRCFGPLIWSYSPLLALLSQSGLSNADYNITMQNDADDEFEQIDAAKHAKMQQVDEILTFAHQNPTSLIHQCLLHMPLMCFSETLNILNGLAVFYPLLVERVLANFSKFTTIAPIDALSLRDVNSPSNTTSTSIDQDDDDNNNNNNNNEMNQTQHIGTTGFGKGLVSNKYPLLIDNCFIIPANTIGTLVSITLPCQNYVTTMVTRQSNDIFTDSQPQTTEMCVVIWHHRWNVLKFITNRLLTPIPTISSTTPGQNDTANTSFLNMKKNRTKIQSLASGLNISYNMIQNVFIPYLGLLSTITRYRFLKAPRTILGQKVYLERYCSQQDFSTILMLAMFMVLDKKDSFCLNVPVQTGAQLASSTTNHQYIQSVATLIAVPDVSGKNDQSNGVTMQTRSITCLTQTSITIAPSLLSTVHTLLQNRSYNLGMSNFVANVNTTNAAMNASQLANLTSLNTSLLNTTSSHITSTAVQTTLYDTHANAQYHLYFTKTQQSHFSAAFFYLFSYACFTNPHHLTQSIVSLYPLLTTAQNNSNAPNDTDFSHKSPTTTTLPSQQALHDPVRGMFVPFSINSTLNFTPVSSFNPITTTSALSPSQTSILAQVFHVLIQHAYQLQDLSTSSSKTSDNEFSTLFSTPLFSSYLTHQKLYARIFDPQLAMNSTQSVFIPFIESPTTIIVGCLEHFLTLAFSIHFSFNMPPEYIQQHQREQQEQLQLTQLFGQQQQQQPYGAQGNKTNSFIYPSPGLNTTASSQFNTTTSPLNSTTMMMSMMKKRQNRGDTTLSTDLMQLPVPVVQHLPIMCSKSTTTQLLSVAIALMTHFMQQVTNSVGDVGSNAMKINFLSSSHLEIISQIAHVLNTALFLHPHVLFSLLDTNGNDATAHNEQNAQNPKFLTTSFLTTLISFSQTLFTTFTMLAPLQTGKLKKINGLRLDSAQTQVLFELCSQTLRNFSTFFSTLFTHASSILSSVDTFAKKTQSARAQSTASNSDNNTLVAQNVTLNAYSDEFYRTTPNDHPPASTTPTLTPFSCPMFSTFPVLITEVFLTSSFVSNTLSSLQLIIEDESARFKQFHTELAENSRNSNIDSSTDSYILPFSLNVHALHSTYMTILRQLFIIFDVISLTQTIHGSPNYAVHINTNGLLSSTTTITAGSKYPLTSASIAVLQTPNIMHEIRLFNSEPSIIAIRTVLSLILRDTTLPWYPIATKTSSDQELDVLQQNRENDVDLYFDDLRKEVVSITLSLISILHSRLSKQLWDVFIKDVKDDDKVLKKIQKHNKSLLRLLSTSSTLLFDSLGYVWEQDVKAINIAAVVAFLVVQFVFHNDSLHNTALLRPLTDLSSAQQQDASSDEYNDDTDNLIEEMKQNAHFRIANCVFSSTLIQQGSEIISWAIESQLCKSLYPAPSTLYKGSTDGQANQQQSRFDSVDAYLSINIHEFWSHLHKIATDYAGYQTQAILHYFPETDEVSSSMIMGCDKSNRNISSSGDRRDLMNESLLFDAVHTDNHNHHNATFGSDFNQMNSYASDQGDIATNPMNTTFNSTYLPVPDPKPSYERTMDVGEVDRILLHSIFTNHFHSLFSILHSSIIVASSTSNAESTVPLYNPLIYTPIRKMLSSVELSATANIFIKLLSQPLPTLDTRVIDRLLGFDIRSTSGFKFHLKQLINSTPTTSIYSHFFISNQYSSIFDPLFQIKQSANPYISTLIQNLLTFGPTVSLLLDQNQPITQITAQNQYHGNPTQNYPTFNTFDSLHHIDTYTSTLQHYNLQLFALSTFSTLTFNICHALKFIQTINSLPNIAQPLPILSIAKTLIYNFYTPLIPHKNDVFDTICSTTDPNQNQANSVNLNTSSSMSLGSNNSFGGGKRRTKQPDTDSTDIFMYKFGDDEHDEVLDDIDIRPSPRLSDDMGESNHVPAPNKQQKQQQQLGQGGLVPNDTDVDQFMKYTTYVNTINKQIKLNVGVTPLSLFITHRLLPFLFSSFVVNFDQFNWSTSLQPTTITPSLFTTAHSGGESGQLTSYNDTSSRFSQTMQPMSNFAQIAQQNAQQLRQAQKASGTPTMRSTSISNDPFSSKIDEIDDFNDVDGMLTNNLISPLIQQKKTSNSTHLLTCLLLTLLASHGVTSSIPISPSLYVDLDSINAELFTVLVSNDENASTTASAGKLTRRRQRAQKQAHNMSAMLGGEPTAVFGFNNNSIFETANTTFAAAPALNQAQPTMIRLCLDAALSQLNVSLPELVQYAKSHNYIDTSFISQGISDIHEAPVFNTTMGSDGFDRGLNNQSNTNNNNNNNKGDTVVKNTIRKLAMTFELAFDTKIHHQKQMALTGDIKTADSKATSGAPVVATTAYSKQYIIEYLLSQMPTHSSFPRKFAMPSATIPTGIESPGTSKPFASAPSFASVSNLTSSGSLFDFLIAQRESARGLDLSKAVELALASDHSGIDNIIHSLISASPSSQSRHASANAAQNAQTSTQSTPTINLVDFITPLLSSLAITIPQMIQSNDTYLKQYASQPLNRCTTCFNAYMQHYNPSAATNASASATVNDTSFNLDHTHHTPQKINAALTTTTSSRNPLSTTTTTPPSATPDILITQDCILCKTASTSSPFIISASLIPVLLQCLYIPACVDLTLALLLPLLQCVASVHSMVKTILTTQIQSYERSITISHLNTPHIQVSNTSFISPLKKRTTAAHISANNDKSAENQTFTHAQLIEIMENKIHCMEALERINMLYSEVLGEVALHFDYILVLYKATGPQHVQRLCHILTLLTTITTHIVQSNTAAMEVNTMTAAVSQSPKSKPASQLDTEDIKPVKLISLDLVHIFTSIMSHPLLLDVNTLISIIHNSGVPRFKPALHQQQQQQQQGVQSNPTQQTEQHFIAMTQANDLNQFLQEQRLTQVTLHYPLEQIHSLVFQYGEVFNNFYRTFNQNEQAFFSLAATFTKSSAQGSKTPIADASNEEDPFDKANNKACRGHFSTFIAMIFNYFTSLIPMVAKMYPLEEVIKASGQNTAKAVRSDSTSTQLTPQIALAHVTATNIHYTLFLHFISMNYHLINYNLVYLVNRHAINTAKVVQFFHMMDQTYPFWRATYCHVQHPANVVNAITVQHQYNVQSSNLIMNRDQFYSHHAHLCSPSCQDTSNPASSITSHSANFTPTSIVDYFEQHVVTIHANIMHLLVLFQAQIYFLHTDSADAGSDNNYSQTGTSSGVAGSITATTTTQNSSFLLSRSSANTATTPGSFDLDTSDHAPTASPDKKAESGSGNQPSASVNANSNPATDGATPKNMAIETVRINDSIFKNKYKSDSGVKEFDKREKQVVNNAGGIETKVKQAQLNLVLLLGLSLSQYISTFTAIVSNVYKCDLQRIVHKSNPVGQHAFNTQISPSQTQSSLHLNFAHPSYSTLSAIASNTNNGENGSNFFATIFTLISRLYQLPFSFTFYEHNKTSTAAAINSATTAALSTSSSITQKPHPNANSNANTPNDDTLSQIQMSKNSERVQRIKLRQNLCVPLRSYRDLLTSNLANPEFAPNMINPSNATGFSSFFPSTASSFGPSSGIGVGMGNSSTGATMSPYHFSTLKSIYNCSCKPSLFYLQFLLYYIAKVIPLITPTQRLLTLLYPSSATSSTSIPINSMSMSYPNHSPDTSPSSVPSLRNPIEAFTLDVNSAARNQHGTGLQFIPSTNLTRRHPSEVPADRSAAQPNPRLAQFLSEINTSSLCNGSGTHCINPNTSLVDYNTYLVQLYSRDIFNTSIFSHYHSYLTNNLDAITTNMINVVRYNQSIQQPVQPPANLSTILSTSSIAGTGLAAYASRAGLGSSVLKTRTLTTTHTNAPSSPQLYQSNQSTVTRVALPFINSCDINQAKSAMLLTMQNLTQQYEQCLFTLLTHISHISSIDSALQALTLSNATANSLQLGEYSSLRSQTPSNTSQLVFGNIQYQNNPLQYIFSNNTDAKLVQSVQTIRNPQTPGYMQASSQPPTDSTQSYTSPLQYLLDTSLHPKAATASATSQPIVAKCPLQPLDQITISLYTRMLQLTGLNDFNQFSQLYAIQLQSPSTPSFHTAQSDDFLSPFQQSKQNFGFPTQISPASPTNIYLFNHTLKLPQLPQLISNSIFPGSNSLLTPQQQHFISVVHHIIVKIHQSILLTPVAPQSNQQITQKQLDLINNIPDVIYLQAIKRFASQIVAFYSAPGSPPQNSQFAPSQQAILLTLFTSHLSLNIADFDALLAHCGKKINSYQQMSSTLSSIIHSHDSMFILPQQVDSQQSGEMRHTKAPASNALASTMSSSSSLISRTQTSRFSSPTKHNPSPSKKHLGSSPTIVLHRPGSSSIAHGPLVGLNATDSNLNVVSQWFLPTSMLAPSPTTTPSQAANSADSTANSQQLLSSLIATSSSSASSFSSIMMLQLLQQRNQCKHTVRIYHLITTVIKAILSEIATLVQNDTNRQQQVHVLLQKQE